MRKESPQQTTPSTAYLVVQDCFKILLLFKQVYNASVILIWGRLYACTPQRHSGHIHCDSCLEG